MFRSKEGPSRKRRIRVYQFPKRNRRELVELDELVELGVAPFWAVQLRLQVAELQVAELQVALLLVALLLVAELLVAELLGALLWVPWRFLELRGLARNFDHQWIVY